MQRHRNLVFIFGSVTPGNLAAGRSAVKGGLASIATRFSRVLCPAYQLIWSVTNLPKIKTQNWMEHGGEPNPLSGQDDGPYGEKPLGDLAGLSQFGVRLERLPTGSRSSYRHWHETEDEFIYLISGELVLIEDEETVLHSGDAAGWKAGQPIAHCLENRSDSEAVLLVVGTRTTEDIVHYPDYDLILRRSEDGRMYTRLDGSPIPGKP